MDPIDHSQEHDGEDICTRCGCHARVWDYTPCEPVGAEHLVAAGVDLPLVEHLGPAGVFDATHAVFFVSAVPPWWAFWRPRWRHRWRKVRYEKGFYVNERFTESAHDSMDDLLADLERRSRDPRV